MLSRLSPRSVGLSAFVGLCIGGVPAVADEVHTPPRAESASADDAFVGLYAVDGRYDKIAEVKHVAQPLQEVMPEEGEPKHKTQAVSHYTLSIEPYRFYEFQRASEDTLLKRRYEENPRWGALTLGLLRVGGGPERSVLYADFVHTKFFMVKQDSPKELLLNASATGGLAGVLAALDAGADPNAPDGNGVSALELASRRGQLRDTAGSFEELEARFAIVRLLLERGARIAPPDDPASYFSHVLVRDAVYDERYPLAKLLVERGGDPAAINLYSVLRSHRYDRARPNLNPERRKLFDELLEGTVFGPERPAESSQILVEAVSSDDAEHFVRRLIEVGADVNYSNYTGHTPLTAAVMAGKAEVVRMLLDAGADPHKPVSIPESDYSMPNDPLDGMTPLQIAVARGDDAISRMLHEAMAASMKW